MGKVYTLSDVLAERARDYRVEAYAANNRGDLPEYSRLSAMARDMERRVSRMRPRVAHLERVCPVPSFPRFDPKGAA